MALDETVKRLRAAREVSDELESPRIAVDIADLDQVLDAADLLCRLERLEASLSAIETVELCDALEHVKREQARERGGSDGR